MNIVNGAEKAAGTGRLATFTFGDVPADKVRALLAALGYKGGPQDPSPRAALRESAEQFVFWWNRSRDTRFERVFARRVNADKVDLIAERVTGDTAAREVVAVATTNGVNGRDDVCDTWRRVFAHYSAHVTSSVIGQWAEQFVLGQFSALPMAARGHTLHIAPAHAAAFDKWLAGMAGLCETQSITFATVDDDPASLASLVAAMRASVEKALVREREKLTAASLTDRGRESAITRIRECRDRLEAYRGVAAGVVSELADACMAAEGEFMLATLGAFG